MHVCIKLLSIYIVFWCVCNLNSPRLKLFRSLSICPVQRSGPPRQFLNGTHEFSELVLARMSLLMDQSRSVLPLRSAKAQELGELWWEKCTRAPWTFPLKLARTSSFRAVLVSVVIYGEPVAKGKGSKQVQWIDHFVNCIRHFVWAVYIFVRFNFSRLSLAFILKYYSILKMWWKDFQTSI